MPDRVLVEQIFLQIVFARAQLEIFGGRKVKCRPFLVQIEQLHAVTMARSVVHSKRTRPQWQPPVKVLLWGIGPLRVWLSSADEPFRANSGTRRPINGSSVFKRSGDRFVRRSASNQKS